MRRRAGYDADHCYERQERLTDKTGQPNHGDLSNKGNSEDGTRVPHKSVYLIVCSDVCILENHKGSCQPGNCPGRNFMRCVAVFRPKTGRPSWRRCPRG
ncbi:hypothetical protein PSAB6_230339 [Paraburkholderia sabiae]|nr:hypothetical protein PSAB6_230339 [Paraburkholderia sabiae]